MNATLFCRPVLSALSLLCLSLLVSCGGGYGGGGGGGGMSMCGGAYGGSCTPTVTVTNVAGTVSGTVTLTATASAQGSYTVRSVQFLVDGKAVGAADTTAPYSVAWNTIGVPNGAHQITAVVTDSVSQQATSLAVTLTVNNPAGNFVMQLAADQVFPQPTTVATGTGNFTVDANTSRVSGSIMLSGVTPTGVEVGDAYAGARSTPVIALTMNASNANQWDVPANTTLSDQQRADLGAGKIYVLVRSARYLDGELRAQLLPTGIVVKFAALAGSAEVPVVASIATGQVAVTVDAANLSAAMHINVAGLRAIGAELASGAVGAMGTNLATLTVDARDPNHYLNEAITLSSVDVSNFTNGLWYGNVFSATHAGGELRGQVVQPIDTAPP